MQAVDTLFINELIRLSLATPDSPAPRIEKMFDWYFGRQVEIGKWALGLASSILVMLLPLLIDKSKEVNYCTVIVAILAIVTSLILAGVKFGRMAQRAGWYVSAIEIAQSVR